MEEKYDLTKYVDRLYSAALNKARDAHVAEDIAQETFLAAVSQLSRGKKPDNLWAWLLTILSNKYCDWLREKYNYPQISFDEHPFEIAQEHIEDDDSAEKLEAVRRELGYLARIHREVMVRFYMHGHTVERIAKDLQIPTGTVKSRLNIGRQHVRKGVTDMENYTKQSYEPDILCLACSGQEGLQHEPFSLVPDSDKLAQSILILAYPKPLTETELAKALGVPAAFVEPVVEKLVAGALMKRTEGGKAYTDFIIYTIKDRMATFEKQLATVENHFTLFWEEMKQGLDSLREKPWYQRQSERARTKLELHFCVKTLMNAHMSVRDEVTGHMPFSEYPYRKDGGRWIAMGMQYPAGYRQEDYAGLWKYAVNGEVGYSEQNFRDMKSLEIWIYGTSFGSYLDTYQAHDYVKWFYELWSEIPTEESAVSSHVLQDADAFIKQGFLRREDKLRLDIPVLSRTEHQEECTLSWRCAEQIAARTRDVLLSVFQSGYVKLPLHLKSVPKWQQYMYCGDSVPMMVIYRAREKGLFLDGVDYPVPASLLVYEK
nr:RNA polymerase sigma factor [uncultured Acetatifactor sp.]